MTSRQKAWGLQALALIGAGAVLAFFAVNAVGNLAARGMVLDYGFLWQRAGFDIPFHLVAWEPSFTYGHALFVAGVNTAFASVLCIALASALGLVLALMRLSGNLLAGGVARVLVEVIRNTPQLTQVVFFYLAVLAVLPPMRQSLSMGGVAFLNVRGLYVPAPTDGPWDTIALATLGVVLVAAVLWRRLGMMVPRLFVLPAVLVAGLALAGWTAGWDVPVLKGFNFVGGVRLPPEVVALVLGISIYTSAFIAEALRAAIQGVHRGQGEAARSLGLTGGQTMFLVVLPQAMRLLVPPLTSQYLNIIKSTTLGAAIAYPEILQIFARTVLNLSLIHI